MTPTDPSLLAALDAALTHVKATAASVAERTFEAFGIQAASTARLAERDLLLAAQFQLRRNMAAFQLEFRDALRQKVENDLQPADTGRRKLGSGDWQTLTLVDDSEVEERLSGDRIAQDIAQECEAVLREVASHVAGLMRNHRAVEDRNPLRAEVIGAALYRAIEAVSDEAETRKLLARDMGLAMARAMPTCYAQIVRDLQARGVQPVTPALRGVEGPGHQLGGVISGYATLPREAGHSSSGADSEFGAHAVTGSGGGAFTTSGQAGRSRSGASVSPGMSTSRAALGGGSGHGALGHPATDVALMTLLRRLTALASRPGPLDALAPAATSGFGASRAGSAGGAVPAAGMGGGASVAGAGGGQLDGLMAVNLIRAHRDELLQASPGQLDHMVIDVVGSLFDQILSDSRVPPQMARQIARLQLPVLRVALHDPSFFSSRKHPVRRFVNRIASLACAFDDFDDGPGAQFLARVSELVQEIVDGDFDQIELYAAKVDALERFIAEQTETALAPSGAAATLEGKESELRIQQRYMLQLQTALAPVPLQPYLREFLAQVWTQALVLAARREGAGSERAGRYRRAARDLVMSVQPKGSPLLRQRFLMQLPGLMKDLKEGMALIGWPEAAQKSFFGQLLPAHAESLKLAPLSELDHNMLAKQVESLFNLPVPGTESLSPADIVPDMTAEVIERRFSAEEAQRVGLVEESAVDWSGRVDIDLDIDLAGADSTEAGRQPGAVDTLSLGLDPKLDLAAAQEPVEPTRGPQLMDHVRVGFAYQMLLKEEWQKVRLTYVSPGRSFFVFSRGRKHQETISLTSRMLARMCETGRLRAVESAYLMERATQRARKQLAALRAGPPSTRPSVLGKP